MTVLQSSEFFVSSILFVLGVLVLCGGVIAINNMLHRFWKPVRFGVVDSKEPVFRFATEDEISNHSKEIRNEKHETSSKL